METQVKPSPAANAPSSNGYRESDDESSPPNEDSPTESPEANDAILTISEAALALGISPAAVRRRIRSGKLPAQRQERPQGHIYMLSQESLRTYRQQQSNDNKPASNGHQEAGAGDEPTIGDALGNGHSNGRATSPEMLLDLLRESRDEIRVLNKELRDVASAASMYQTRNEMLEERLLLLQAPPQRRRWYNWPWTKMA